MTAAHPARVRTVQPHPVPARPAAAVVVGHRTPQPAHARHRPAIQPRAAAHPARRGRARSGGGGRGAAEAAASVPRHDVALGLSACGRTPYVLAALGTARRADAATVLITSDPTAGDDPAGGPAADVLVVADTGPEPVAGSTEAGGELKTALVSVLGGVEVSVARQALAGSGGQVRRALDALPGFRT